MTTTPAPRLPRRSRPFTGVIPTPPANPPLGDQDGDELLDMSQRDRAAADPHVARLAADHDNAVDELVAQLHREQHA